MEDELGKMEYPMEVQELVFAKSWWPKPLGWRDRRARHPGDHSYE